MQNRLIKYKLNQGDIIRIGRITCRIKDIIFNNNEKDNKNNVIKLDDNIKLEEISTPKLFTKNEKKQIKNCKNMKNSETSNNIKKNKKISKKSCRICYLEEDDEENPLLQPCICSGSMKYIHLDCLKHWISTRSFDKIDSNEICSIFIVKPIECELCKTKLPDFVRHKGKLYNLFEYRYEYNNYLTLESLTLDRHKNKFLYVISLDKLKKIKMGRSHDANIILSDISVSRIHSLMTIENKNVYIEDNNSKFGTLVLCQSPKIKLSENLPLYFQVGRTFFIFCVKKIQKFFNCCGVSERPSLYEYHKQNQAQINSKKLFTVKTENDDENSDSEEEFEEVNDIIEELKSDIENNKNNDEEKSKRNLLKRLDRDFGIRGTMLYDDNDLDIDYEENKKKEDDFIKEDINDDENFNNVETEKNKNEKEGKNEKESSISINLEDESDDENDIKKLIDNKKG